MEHILPYKIGRVLFVPNTSGIVSQAKECVVSSSMARDNKLELLQLKQNTLSHSSSKSLESPITDMKWVSHIYIYLFEKNFCSVRKKQPVSG